MKIYAIRDRLIDYFMQPFVGPDDKHVLAAVARNVNEGALTSDIAQAPHHFEVWSLAKITENGHIEEDRYLIADCSSLVRTGLRTAGDRNPEDAKGDPRPNNSHTTGSGSGPSPNTAPIPSSPQATPDATTEVRRGPRGGYPPRNGI